MRWNALHLMLIFVSICYPSSYVFCSRNFFTTTQRKFFHARRQKARVNLITFFNLFFYYFLFCYQTESKLHFSRMRTDIYKHGNGTEDIKLISKQWSWVILPLNHTQCCKVEVEGEMKSWCELIRVINIRTLAMLNIISLF